ncbi:TldE/PmbA family protein [Chitinimonas sp. BJB300]|nr:TldE/PmbA family protein [Chitinimonas sp. BJB300]TSJ87190.1 TldE/PmbA family protein [Chitinimonas sp. BJB300]
MRQYFDAIAADVFASLSPGEQATLWLAGETSDFVRFNHAKVRQAGEVKQLYMTVHLLLGQKHVSQKIALAGILVEDSASLHQVLVDLRSIIDEVADDPYLLMNTELQSTEHYEFNLLPPTEQMVADIMKAVGDADLVGILAAGPVFKGFANSLGQRNWHEVASWNFNWSLYSHGDKAVKRGAAGTRWDTSALKAAIAEARSQLALLARPAKTLSPGSYRAYLTPTAVSELVGMLNWGGFSEREMRSKRSSLLKLASSEARFSPLLSLRENTAAGLSPAFQREGFIKPDYVALVQEGRHAGNLVSPRTAREFGIVSNGASGGEESESLDMAAGSLPKVDILKALGTGIYVSNLWYLNFSDRAACRITGMTRFACFWVKNGEIVAPLDVMRFDDSLFRLLGSELEALTAERELLVDPGSYEARSTASQHLPGALVRSLNLVL